MKSKIGIILIIIGVIIITCAVYMNLNAKYNQQAMIQNFNNLVERYEEDQENQQNSTTSNENVPYSGTDSNRILGIMIIPRIDLEAPIMEGLDNETLKYAIGHFNGTVKPGEKGNCAVAGHRSYAYNQLLNRLDEVQSGDEITIKLLDKKLRYLIYDKKIVNPDDLSVLDNTEDSIITLITCHPQRSSAYRLIVKARLQ